MAVREGRIRTGDSTADQDTTTVPRSPGYRVHRPGVVIADPETAAARAAVSKDDLQADYAAHVRDLGRLVTNELLTEIRDELKLIVLHLASMTDEEFEDE